MPAHGMSCDGQQLPAYRLLAHTHIARLFDTLSCQLGVVLVELFDLVMKQAGITNQSYRCAQEHILYHLSKPVSGHLLPRQEHVALH